MKILVFFRTRIVMYPGIEMYFFLTLSTIYFIKQTVQNLNLALFDLGNSGLAWLIENKNPTCNFIDDNPLIQYFSDHLINYENKFIDRIFLKLIISAGDTDSFQKMNLPRFRLSEKYPVVKWTLLILPLLLLLPLVVADIQVNHLFIFHNMHKYE